MTHEDKLKSWRAWYSRNREAEIQRKREYRRRRSETAGNSQPVKPVKIGK